MAGRDVVEFHEVGNFWLGLDFSGSFHILCPGGMASQRSPFSPLPRVSSVFGQVTPFLVTDEALLVPNVRRPFTRGEIDLVYVHCIGIQSRGSASRGNVAVSPSSEFPKSYHVSVEFPSFVEPLFPLPISLSVWKGSGSHHDGQLLGYPSLEGIH